MTTIQVRTQFVGVHCYPDAPEEVKYLRHPHRHTFRVTLEVEVFHDDRELEFICVKHWIDDYFFEMPMVYGEVELDSTSCEQIGNNLLDHMALTTPRADERYWKVTVDEDGENGATVERKPEPVKMNISIERTGAASEGMTLDRYQELAYRNIQEHYNQKEEVMHWAIGLGEEAGEALSVVKHRYYAGCYKDDDDMLEDIVGELGDTLWHIAALCTSLGIGLEDVAQYNIAKLENRYPDGRFDKERSENRHDIQAQWKKEISHDEVMAAIREKRRK